MAISKMDSFYKEIVEAKKIVCSSVSKEESIAHLRKLNLWNRSLLVVALLTLYLPFPYALIPILSLSVYTTTRWTIIGHHVCHGGYDKCNDPTYKRGKFGLKWRRFVDWFDWFLVEAWNIEHNKYHHYQLNEVGDPDLVESNFESLRAMIGNKFYGIVSRIFFFALAVSWRWLYYAPNTFDKLYMDQNHKGRSYMTVTLNRIFSRGAHFAYEYIWRVFLPYFGFMYVAVPYAYSLLGFNFNTVLINIALAEFLSNIHSFMIVVPNHCGDDLYRFDTGCVGDTKQLVYRSALGSVNYTYGTDLIDFLHGFLNYQIEHHMFPDLSALEYQRLAPKVKEICLKHDVQYIEQNVFMRVKKTYDIAVGNAKMKMYNEKKDGLEALAG
eukprot:Colp12_sorted_trinity150504_noHs@31416